MAATTGNTAMDDVFATWINKAFIEDLEFELQHQKAVTEAEMTPGLGANIARFVDYAPPRRAVSYSGAGQASIAEASTTANEITSITTNPTNITISEFGEFLKIGELFEYAAVSGTRERLAKRLRDGGGLSIDQAVINQAILTTNIYYATAAQAGGTTSSPAAVTAMGASTLMGANKLLYDGLAQGFEGAAGVTNRNFIAIISPKQDLDIVTEVTTLRVYWSNAVVNVPGAMGQEKIIKGYIADFYGITVLKTQNYNTATFTSAIDIGFVYATGGLAGASFGQMQPKAVINDVNSPYKNVNSIAWHCMFGVGLVSSARVVKLYSLS